MEREFLQAEGGGGGPRAGEGAEGRLSLEVSGGDGSIAWSGVCRQGAQGDLVAVQDGGGGVTLGRRWAGGLLGEQQGGEGRGPKESQPDLEGGGAAWGLLGGPDRQLKAELLRCRRP